jgi:glutathione reductase (NADPH)
MQKLDLFVIGAGSAGVRAARIAATHGAKVMIAENDRIGGTCVIRGCVPKKLLVYASHYQDEFEDAKGYGFTFEKPLFNWATLRDNVLNEVTRLEGIYERNMKAAGVEVIKAGASFLDAHTLQLTTGETVHADKILIATGGKPFVDTTIEGHELAVTSNDMFNLDHLPKAALVVGGGYIAVEFAGILKGLGVETHLCFRSDKVLKGFDEDVRDHLTTEYLHKGIQLHAGKTIKKITKSQVIFTDGTQINVDLVLMATGRVPNIDGLNLANIGVETAANGAVKVAANGQTSIANIYAAGDVTDRVNLTPVAIREGHAFADSFYGNKEWVADHSLIPTAVFSQPEIGTIGMSEQDALKLYDIDIYKASFRAMKHTISGRQTKMLMKLIVDQASDLVLGCHIVGDAAGEMIQLAGIAIKMKATKRHFDATMAVHPTAAEELVTMRMPSYSHKKLIS